MADRIPKAKPTRKGRVSGAIDQSPQRGPAHDEDGRVCGSRIRTVKTQHDPNWTRTRERSADCRTLLAGEMPQILPENFKMAGADNFAADLPATYTRPAEMLAQNLKKQVEIKRFITTDSQRAKTTSSTIEQALTAVMTQRKRGYPWPKSCDIVQNDALGCVITQPMPTFWEQAPDWQDPETKTFKDRYQRDSQGRSKGDADKGFRPNKKASKKAYEEDLADWRANHVPVMYRAFGPQEFTAIYGPNDELEAVIVCGMYQRTSEMAMRFQWGEDDHLSPSGTNDASYGGSSGGSGAYGEVEILEYWGYDKDRKPYVSYCVDGMATTYTDGEPAVVDLSPYCSTIPVAVAWGQHWPGAPRLDQRALPYMWAFLKSIKQANAIATGIAVALWWAGFPTYVTDRSAATVPISPGATPRTLDIEPLKLIETDGPVTRLSGGEVSKDAWQFMSLLLGENEKAQPSSGDASDGGFAQTIAKRYSEDAQHQILEGIRQLYEESASFTLEILTNIAKSTKQPVLVYYAGPVISLAENDNVSSTRARLELTPDLAGEQWQVTARYRPSMSLAERQQSAELVERRLKTRYKHLEDDGDPAPERTLAQIEAEDMVASEMGQQQRWALIAKILDDDQMAEMIKLKTDQRVAMQSGLPFSLAEGFEDILAKRAAAESASSGGAQMPMPAQMPAPMPGAAPGPQGIAIGVPQGGQMTGLGGPSDAQASLAGAVGGELSTQAINRAAAAGGAVPSDLMGGGV